MVGNAQVQQFVNDDEILKFRVLMGEVGGQGDDSPRWNRNPTSASYAEREPAAGAHSDVAPSRLRDRE